MTRTPHPVEPARRVVPVRGRRVGYLECGPREGPVVLLLHGLASDAGTWDRALPELARRGLRALALDLPGHGHSDPGPGGYLLDDFTVAVKSFLDAVQIRRATVCGHSLGGAIAVHLGYHHPGYVQRLVLVSAGGLGREVHPVLRAAALPGAPAVLGAALHPGLRRLYRWPRLHRALRLTQDNLTNLRRAGQALGERAGRQVFFAALRGVIEPGGQRGSLVEMRYLAESVPTLLVWSERDPVIPVTHAHALRAQLPGTHLVLLPGTGHEPHRRHAAKFADAVADFITASPVPG